MRINKFNERGQMMVMALILMAILLLLSTGLIGYTVMHRTAERRAITGEQALHLAEAGLEKALDQLNQNSNYSGEKDTPLGDGTFSITITSLDANNKRVAATGYIPDSANPASKRTVKATAIIDLATVSFQFGVQMGLGGATLDNTSVINGNIFTNGNIDGKGTITGDATVAAGTAESPDQQWTNQTADFLFGNINSRADTAQSFIPSITNTVNKASVYLKKVGSPGDLAVQIVADNSGKPSKTVLTSGTISASSIATSYAFVDAWFATTPTLTSGQKYWLMLIAAVNSSNYYSWGIDTGNGYANNIGSYSQNWNTGNPAWNDAGGDFDFKILMGGIVTSITDVEVLGNARATSLLGCTVSGSAYFLSINTCTVDGGTHSGTLAPAPQGLPVSSAQIAEWEAKAESGGTIADGYVLDGVPATLGPKKINGDLTVDNGGILYITGPIWVNGNINLSNNTHVLLDSSLGDNGTVLLADYTSSSSLKGRINVDNNVVIAGNGNTNSFPMLLSTYDGTAEAINLSNNASGSIFYATSGVIGIYNNVTVKTLAGYGVRLHNGAVVNYTNGLQNATFSQGPGGSWIFKPGSYVLVK